MSHKSAFVIAALIYVASSWAGVLTAAGRQSTPAGPTPASASESRAVIDRYCVTCHNERTKAAGLTLDTLDVAHVPQNAEVWERGMVPTLR